MTTVYDTVVYPNLCLAQTHPDRLAVVANLLGLDPAPPEGCRVLEIGCGDGSNLLPLAYTFPGSHFTGFDLAETRVAAGRRVAAELGLSNLELNPGDIMTYPREGEPFDYIIAHGIYSWIPAPVRDALLGICRGRLAAQGVAYVSYNCLPGGLLRRLARDIMRFHIRDVHDPREQVRQAVAVTQFIAGAITKPDPYRQLFKEQLEQVERHGAAHLFHDDLAEINDPVYFHEFAAHAGRHDLQYLGEADFFEMQDEAFSDEARRIFAQMQDSRLTREQYLDFVKCRRFRQTLLCRAEVTLAATPQASALERFEISSHAEGAVVETGPGGAPIERFAEKRGGAIRVGHPVGKRALHLLAECWPATRSFGDLFEAACAGAGNGDTLKGELQTGNGDTLKGELQTGNGVTLKGELQTGKGESRTARRAELAEILLEAYRAGVVELRRTPVRCLARPSARPAAWSLARWQAARFESVTTLRGENLRLGDAIVRDLLQLVDGTRTVPEVEAALRQRHPEVPPPGTEEKSPLAPRLEELARLGLLEA